MSSFFSELRRRNVFKVAVAYAIVGWILVEVASVFLPGFDAPDWVFKVVMLLVILGFPMAVVFAWAFELTPAGLKREKEVDRSQSITARTGRKLDFIIIGVLAIAVVLFAVDKFARQVEDVSEIPEPADAIPSIAVLPFENRSTLEEDEFFVDGIHDDLLTLLAKLGNLKVIARTTMVRLDPALSIQEIGTKLGVSTVVEGGVQRAGDRVRINVQLIDANTEVHIWAEKYDRELTAANVFDIQSEIATAIADALQAALSPRAQERLNTAPTSNMAALQAYFLGKQRMVKRTSTGLAEAVDYFQEAISADPDFALAYVGLADSFVLQEEYTGLPAEDMFAKAEVAIARALKLDDQLGEAYTSLAAIRGDANDPDGAETAFKTALELNPNYPTAYHWYGIFLRGLGRPEEVLALFEKGVELDPLSPIINHNLAFTLFDLGRYDEAIAQYLTTLEIEPEFPSSHYGLGFVHWYGYGRLDKAVPWFLKAIARDPLRSDLPSWLGIIYLDLGDDSTAESLMLRASNLGPDNFRLNRHAGFLHLYHDDTARAAELADAIFAVKPKDAAAHLFVRNQDLALGRLSEARHRYATAFPELVRNDQPKIDHENNGAAIDFAYLLMSSSEPEAAERLLSELLHFVQTRHRPAWFADRTWYGYWLAIVRIYAMQGKTDRALTALKEALDEVWHPYWWYYLEQDPSLDSIRNEPEFQAMLADVKAKMAEQLANVRAMEASGELTLPLQ